MKSAEYVALVSQLTYTQVPKGVKAGQLVNVLEAGSIVSGLSKLWPGVDHIGVTVSMDTVDPDFGTSLYHLIVSQHTDRESRIKILEAIQNAKGIDPLIVFINETINVLTEKVASLRAAVAEHTERQEVEDGNQGNEKISDEAHLAQYEKKLLSLVKSRDSIIVDTYGGDSSFVDQWLRVALENAGNDAQSQETVSPAEPVGPTPDFPLLQFRAADDHSVYFLCSDGRIIRAPELDEPQSPDATQVINDDQPPLTVAALRQQLLDLGLTAQQATALIERSGFDEIERMAAHVAETQEHFHDYQVHVSERLLVADIALLGAQQQLVSAVQDGDLTNLVQAVFGYYSAASQRASLTELGSSSAGPATLNQVVSGLQSAVALGQAIEDSDTFSMLAQGAGLLGQIDRYLVANGHESLLGSPGSSALSLGASSLSLLQALDNGNGWAMAQSSVDLAIQIDQYLAAYAAADATSAIATTGAEINATGTALQGLASVIGLVLNLSQLDEVLESGDAGAIAITAANTAHHAVNAYNSAATLANASKPATVSSPALSYAGYAAAALQAADGDTRGAAISAASTYLMSCPPYGWIFALVLQIGNMMVGSRDQPEATASFSLDADGTITVHVGGDAEMQEAAGSSGWSLVPVLESYRDAGGRLLIDGAMPRLNATAGEPFRIIYDDSCGGRIEVRLDDMSRAAEQLRGVLYARDRGERLDRAVQTARSSDGRIDLQAVDAVMAGYGFTRRGSTYVTGETSSRIGSSTGSGVIRGGGNQGPQDRLFVAEAKDVTSLPIPPDQLPAQRMGQVLRVAGLNTLFGGSGADMLAMSLILPGGLLGLAAATTAASGSLADDHPGIRPATPAELNEYRQWLQQLDGSDAAPVDHRGLDRHEASETAWSDKSGLAAHPASTWAAQSSLQAWSVTGQPGDALSLRDAQVFTGWQHTGSLAAWWQRNADGALTSRHLRQEGMVEQAQVFAQPQQHPFSGGRVEPFAHTDDNSFPDSRVEAGASASAADEAALPDQPEEPPPAEPHFRMAEDTILRFLPAELLEDTLSGAYGLSAEQPLLRSLDGANHGSVWIDDNGDIRFAPDPGFVGTASFSFTVQLPDGTTRRDQAIVRVENVNDEPVAAPDRFTLQEGQPFFLDHLLVNDYDPDGDPLVLDHLRGVTRAEVSVVDGRLALVPEPGFVGDIEFSYWIRDAIDAYPVMATACLTYEDVNGPPLPGSDRFLIREDSTMTTSVEQLLANDREFDGETIRFVALGAARHGTVTLGSGGAVSFTPEADYAGNDAGFSYEVVDESGNRAVGWAHVEVLASREPPVVMETTRPPIDEDEILVFSPQEVAIFLFDPDGDDLRLESVSNVSGGSFITVDGYLAFQPAANYAGPAFFDYRASDNHRGFVEGSLAFTVTAVNDPIDTGDDLLTTREDQAVTTSVADLLANDTDVDGTVFTFVALGEAHRGSVAQDADGTITFTPEAHYHGDQAGFFYRVADSEAAVSEGWVQVAVAPVNDRPEVLGGSLMTDEDVPLSFDAPTLARLFSDPDGDPLSVVDCQAITGGRVVEQGGLFSFVPQADYHGPALLSLSVADPHGETVEAHISLAVEPVDDPTRFADTTLPTTEETPVSIKLADLLAGSSDPDGPLRFAELGAAVHGSVDLTDDGTVQFTPDHDYFGTAAGFTYAVVDGDGNEAQGWVAVHVTNRNDRPQPVADRIVGQEDQPVVFSRATLARFLTDPDGDDLVLTSLSPAGPGRVETDGTVFSYVPEADFHGETDVLFTCTDGQGETLTGRLTLAITPVDDPTDFGIDVFATREEEPLVLSVADLMGNDSDPDGRLQFIGLGEARHGTASLSADGQVEFVPELDYFGADAGFFYGVRDEENNEAWGWVTVDVENVADQPIMVADRLLLREDQPLLFTPAEVSRFLRDPDGEQMHLDTLEVAAGGRIESDAGLFRFVPDPDWYGETTLSYRAVNDSGEAIDGRLNVAVLPVNDLPVVGGATLAGWEDEAVSIALAELMAGAADVEDGTAVRFEGFVDATNGDVWLDGDGIIHFLPEDDYFGPASFSYRVTDSEGGTTIGAVELTITGVNDEPLAVDDDLVAWSNSGYENVWLPTALLANDSDADFDALAITGVGSARFGSVALAADGTVRYTAPAADWVGIDSFSYRISDGNGGTAEATATLAVKINTSPDVYPELIFTREDEIVTLGAAELLANDSDVDNDPLTIVGVEAGEHCQVELQADGTVLFRPELNYNNCYPGQAWFTYTVSDGISELVDSVAFFDIEPVNDRPILVPEIIDGAVEDNDFQFTIAQLLANDTDVEMASAYEEDAIAFAGLGGATHGSISYDPSTGAVSYRSDPDFFGTDTFSYHVVDSYGAVSTVQSHIRVAGVNDLPVVQEDVGSPAEEYIWNYYRIDDLVSNDYDVDGDRLSIHSPRVVRGDAQVSISGGNLAVKPAIGTDRVAIDYVVSDGNGGEVPSRLTIPQILEHNFAPQFTNLYAILLHVNIGGMGPWSDFSFQVRDQNGGDNWVEMGDIAAISAGRLRTNYANARLIQKNDRGEFSFRYSTHDMDETVDYFATFTITAVDRAGATGTIFVDFDKLATRKGTYTYQYSPVVLDLDGDGVELLALGEEPRFDWNGDGRLDVSGWVGCDDAFLVYDYDADRRVTHFDEISLVGYVPDAATDLQGLRAFDSNGNSLLDSGDETWASFGTWQDKDGDGLTGEDEFKTLDEQGITAISLESDETYHEIEGNHVYGSTSCQMADGSTLTAADVGLAGGEITSPQRDDALQQEREASAESKTAEQIKDSADEETTTQVHAPPTAELSLEPQDDRIAEKSDNPDELGTEVPATDEQGLDSEPVTEALATDEEDPDEEPGTEAPATDAHAAEDETEPSLTDADLNRLAEQLISDMAACPDGEEELQHYDDLDSVCPAAEFAEDLGQEWASL
ncbi:tandem-95 repeat protein [Desulfofustis limnaeus]|uniref:tandem-95 repeat protein n=1 Tax=Desulfofustis limnaeus TaxID=2740163 RepID=UPI0024DFC5B2|nr:tandem-95 repeat protein [Desulfofustis limnaeus]